MNRTIIHFMLLTILVLVMGLPVPTVRAAGVVGTGTAASCTEAAFANALSGGGTVTFNCGGAATITLTNQQLITLDTTIDGGGVITLSGGDTTRLFFSNDGVSFTLNNITLRDGASAVGGGVIEASGAYITLNNSQILSSTATDNGGAIYCFRGSDGTLTLNGSTLDGNTANRGGGIYNDGCTTTINNSSISNNDGTGLYHDGVLTVTNSVISRNRGGDGGGVFIATNSHATLHGVTLDHNISGYGGGIENSGSLTITDSLIHANEVTGSGGGIWNMSGKLWMERTTVSDNSAFEGGGINSYGNQVDLFNVNITGNSAFAGPGGGIYHGAGVFYVTNATINNNRAVGVGASGGGVYQNSEDNLTLMNVTLANNQAGAFGGGFYHQARYGLLVNVTLANNTATMGGAAIYENATPSPSNPGVLQVVNTVLFGSANNCDGTLFDTFGHNISAGTCGSLTHGSDQVVNPADILLDSLRFNGGAFAMQTIVPLAGSPVINAGSTSDCPALDQRGAARVGPCDSGATEYGATLPRVFVPLVLRDN